MSALYVRSEKAASEARSKLMYAGMSEREAVLIVAIDLQNHFEGLLR